MLKKDDVIERCKINLQLESFNDAKGLFLALRLPIQQGIKNL